MYHGTPAAGHGPSVVSESLNRNCGFHYATGELLHRHRSDWQLLEVLETPEFGRVLRVDGITMTSEHDEFYYHENLVHVPALAHRGPQNVLIIGGGDGGALEEVLKHACVRHVSLVELDPAVIELSSRYLESIHRGAFRDPRVTLHFADGRHWLTSCEHAFDLILLDLTDPVGPSQALYTAEFYELCRTRLAQGGVLALHVQSPVARPQTFARIAATLRSVFAHVRPYLVYVPTYGTWFAMATASTTVDPIADSVAGIMSRFDERALGELRFYNPATHFAGFALPNFVLDLLRQDVAIVTDAGERLDGHPEFDCCCLAQRPPSAVTSTTAAEPRCPNAV
ncbi:MAG TPA: polyamine aminopropyltransferase [Burkholderiales bacterium]|nr:polyamine aminopropyltransferase [Burkholderiales bacterium]